jgi:hypothetical protein
MQEVFVIAKLPKFDAYQGKQATKLALKLLVLNFVCETELAEATRDEVHLDEGAWRIVSSAHEDA